MKLKFSIITILLPLMFLTVVITSCKKYLDVEPTTIAGNADVVFSTPDSVEKVIVSIYDPLQGDYGYGDRLSIYYQCDDDITTASSNAADGTRGFFNHFNFVPTYDNVLMKNPWIWFFTGVERANIAIYYIPKMAMYSGGTESQKDSLKRFYGEALTLRAFYFSELVKLWGDVPASFLPAAQTPNLYMARTDRYVIYDQILKDLELAEDLLPWRTEGNISPDRISKGFAKGLRAKIALFAGGYTLKQDGTKSRASNYLDYYQIARKETADLIANRTQHNLNPDFRAVFKDYICAHAFEPNGEILFEVSNRFAGGKTGSKLGYDCGPRMSGGSNRGNAFIRILPTYFYMFDSTDVRRDVTIAPYQITLTTKVKVPQTYSEIVDGKFRKDWISNPTPAMDGTNGQNFGLNFPIMRFSDVLLMYAEAENEINGPSGAVAALNEVRNRAHAPSVFPASKEDMFNAIVKERALELGCEAIRKYDLMRWNLLETKMKEAKQTLDAIAHGLMAIDKATNDFAIPAPYDTLPRVMYLKDGGINGLAAGNSYYRPKKSTDPAVSGYTKVNWLQSVYSSGNITASNPYGLSSLFANYALGTLPVGNGFGFVAGKHELLPIPTFAITTNPYVTQNYGY